jgi:hypothetical protein
MKKFLKLAWVFLLVGTSSGIGVIAYGVTPKIDSTSPPNGAVGVRPDLDRIYVRFDRPITWGEGICLEVSEGWQNPAVIKWEDNVIHIIRQGADLPDLPLGSVHRFVLNPEGSGSSCFMDLKGDLVTPYEFSFTVRATQGDPPIEPQVVSTLPANGRTGVDPNITEVSVTFNKPMDEPSRVWGEGFGNGAVSWSADKMTWRYKRDTAGTPLRAGSTVIFILNPDYSDNFKDTQGNILRETTFWFTVQGDQETDLKSFYNVDIHRFEANPEKGFHWPYYLSVPRDIRGPTVLMVGPNNSGFPAFDQAWHDFKAKSDLYWLTSFVWKLHVPILVPTFPRLPNAYIQNLEGSAFWPHLPADLQRIDLQLLAMIQDARETLQAGGVETQDRVFMTGFSASGAFTSNFTVLHPEVVKASASGGMGWRCAPVSSWDGIQHLSYPMGVGNLEALTGCAFDLPAFKKVPQYLYAGDQDTVGYIAYDALEPADRDRFRGLIDEANLSFQDSLLKGWALNQEIYDSIGTEARFVLYPGAGHNYTDQMLNDVRNFFRRHLSARTACPPLGNGYSLSGGSTSAQFYGGITSDGGGSFRDRFSASETIQILMTIGPDFNDVDWQGTIYVIGALNGIWFCRHGNGAWSPWDGTLEGLVKTYQRQKLLAVEPVAVASLPLKGLEGTSFQFVAAYGDSNGQIYYHWPPLSFTVTP